MSRIKIGFIGGSGLGEAMLARTQGQRHEIQTPFGRPSDAIIETELAGMPLLFLSRHGPGHLLNPSQVPSRANVFALKQLGCTHVIASGAVGSLRDEFRPRDLVIPNQIIDKTHRRPNTFYERAAVHVDFAEPFCPVLRRILIETGQQLAGTSEMAAPAPAGNEAPAAPSKPTFAVHDHGCYVCMEGPAFSTRAESLMHRLWGGDLIGMTLMPEARLAREAEISYATVALVTDYDCWREGPRRSTGGRPHKPGEAAQEADAAIVMKQVIENLQAASENALHLIQRVIEQMASRQDELAASPVQHALRLAIWSDKSRVAPEEVQRLAPLWGGYFQPEGA